MRFSRAVRPSAGWCSSREHAKILTSIGFSALATTSAGFAGTLGRLDGGVTRDEVVEHARVICAATDLPVSADLENCFAHEPAGVATTIALAIESGLVGGSCEDDIRRLVDAVGRPVNVLAPPGTASVAERAAIGVKRISVGSGFSNVAAGALATAGRELLEQGTYDYWATAMTGMMVTHEAFG